MSEFTQGVCADGAAILKDGVMLTIEEIIELLRQGDALMGRGEPVAIAKTRREFHEYENSALEDEVGYLVTHVNWVKKPQDVGELKLYTQAPAVSSDPARFRQIGFTHIDHIGKPSSTIVSDTKYRAASDAGVYVPVFVDEGETLAPAVDGAVIREAIRAMDDGERLDIFSEYCRCCGSNDPTCQCWNDE